MPNRHPRVSAQIRFHVLRCRFTPLPRSDATIGAREPDVFAHGTGRPRRAATGRLGNHIAEDVVDIVRDARGSCEAIRGSPAACWRHGYGYLYRLGVTVTAVRIEIRIFFNDGLHETFVKNRLRISCCTANEFALRYIVNVIADLRNAIEYFSVSFILLYDNLGSLLFHCFTLNKSNFELWRTVLHNVSTAAENCDLFLEGHPDVPHILLYSLVCSHG